MKKDLLIDQMKKSRGLMLVAEANHQSTLKLQSEFYKLSKEYKKIWLKTYEIV